MKEITLTNEEAVLVWFALIERRQRAERARELSQDKQLRENLLREERELRAIISRFKKLIFAIC